MLWLGIAISLSSALLYTSRVLGNATLEVAPISVKMIRSDGVVIFVITLTYARPVQKAELTRLSQTFRLVPDLHWIIVEDAKEPTQLVATLLRNSGLPYTHLIQPAPGGSVSGKIWQKEVGQRNVALRWIRKNLLRESGVIYFADDDNTYSIELFEEMRKTKRVSIWPVGLVGGLLVEKPYVEDGKVVGFNAEWRAERKFPVDMAGFAVSLKHFREHPEAQFSLDSAKGHLETDFVELLTTKAELEPLAANCTKILVWHTRTERPNLFYENRLKKLGFKASNFGME